MAFSRSDKIMVVGALGIIGGVFGFASWYDGKTAVRLEKERAEAMHQITEEGIAPMQRMNFTAADVNGSQILDEFRRKSDGNAVRVCTVSQDAGQKSAVFIVPAKAEQFNCGELLRAMRNGLKKAER